MRIWGPGALNNMKEIRHVCEGRVGHQNSRSNFIDRPNGRAADTALRSRGLPDAVQDLGLRGNRRSHRGGDFVGLRASEPTRWERRDAKRDAQPVRPRLASKARRRRFRREEWDLDSATMGSRPKSRSSHGEIWGFERGMDGGGTLATVAARSPTPPADGYSTVLHVEMHVQERLRETHVVCVLSPRSQASPDAVMRNTWLGISLVR